MKYAVVTAATSPIGEAIARNLAGESYTVILHYNKNKAAAEKLAQELGGELIQGDFSNAHSIVSFAESLAAKPKISLLVNNAGLSAEDKEGDISTWETVLRINTVAPAIIMEYALRFMARESIIVNISSIYGHEYFGDTEFTAYSASKAALNSLTRTFAKKLAPNIRVNAIAPGFVDSNWNKEYSPSDRERIANAALTGKLVQPAQVADLVTCIANNSALNGEVIYLDGGQILK